MKRIVLATFCIGLIGCGQTINVGGGSSNPGVSYSCPSGTNVMSITVNGSLCNSSTMYANEPCASVTICPVGSASSGSANCQTVNDILVDTGSYGLRVFSSVLGAGLKAGMTQTSSGNVAECAHFGSGKTWGSVLNADIYLAGEPKATVPIQLIDNTYSGGDSTFCSGSDTSPSVAGYNGILGIGLEDYDCGSHCTGATPEPDYFSCTGASCSGTSSPACTLAYGMDCGIVVPFSAPDNQVQNPIAHFSSGSDTNGALVLLAAANPSGNLYDNGCVVFGVATQANNTPSSINVYAANANDEFSVKVNGTTLANSFIDSGSNGYYLPPNFQSIPMCSGWFCPTNTMSLSVVPSAPMVTTSISIANANTLFGTSNFIFNDLAGQFSSGTADLGLPFFFGRAIYVGINGKSATAPVSSTGPYWAY